MTKPVVFYELARRKIDPPTPGQFVIASAAVWDCALCCRPIDGMGGPGDGEICEQCGDALRLGKLRGAVVWEEN